MRLASLQPSITLTLAALGKLDCLCAHTRYCLEALPELAEMNLPVLSDSWTANTAEILATNPTLIVASVPYRMESLAAILKASLPLMAFAPHTLTDIRNDIRLLGSLTDASSEAEALSEHMASTVDSYRSHSAGLLRPRVYCEEWGKPLIHSQRWVAELIEAAGGEFVGSPGEHTDAVTIANAEPDVLIFSWCGAGDRVPLEKVISQRGWQELQAVKQRRVFCVPDEFLNTPAHTLLEGLACLGAAIQPDTFPPAKRLVQLTEAS